LSNAALVAPLPQTASAPRSTALADLVLTRLLVAPNGVSARKIRDDLAPFFRRPPTLEQVNEAIAELRGDGFIPPGKGQTATDAGRARALNFLGIVTLPAKANWGTVKAKFLTPKALGLAAASEETTKTCRDAKSLSAFLLKRELALPVGTGSSLNAVFEAIACRELGYPEHTTLKSLLPALLAKVIRSDSPLAGKNAESVVPRVLLKTHRGGMAGLRDAALSGWADAESSAITGSEPQPIIVEEAFDLEMFANSVRSEAKRCPSGWFGDNKVFISHVWEQLKSDRPFATLGLDGFKQRLVEANRAGKLTLSRADLVQLMDPADVRDSEVIYLTATFHFVLVERD